ncbi:hypothetical protein [Collimonas arenae]
MRTGPAGRLNSSPLALRLRVWVHDLLRLIASPAIELNWSGVSGW